MRQRRAEGQRLERSRPTPSTHGEGTTGPSGYQATQGRAARDAAEADAGQGARTIRTGDGVCVFFILLTSTTLRRPKARRRPDTPVHGPPAAGAVVGRAHNGAPHGRVGVGAAVARTAVVAATVLGRRHAPPSHWLSSARVAIPSLGSRRFSTRRRQGAIGSSRVISTRARTQATEGIPSARWRVGCRIGRGSSVPAPVAVTITTGGATLLRISGSRLASRASVSGTSTA